MSQLHRLVEQIIDTLRFGLQPAIKQISAADHPSSPDYTAILGDINTQLNKTTREENPDIAVLHLLFNTVKLIHYASKTNCYLDDALKMQITNQLFNLFATLNMLYSPLDMPSSPLKSSESLDGFLLPGSPRQTFGEYNQIQLNGLLGDDGYTNFGLFIHEHFDELLQLSNTDSNALSLKIAEIIEHYQQEVGPLHQRLETQRLEKIVQELKAQLENQPNHQKELARLQQLNVQLEKKQQQLQLQMDKHQSMELSRLRALILQKDAEIAQKDAEIAHLRLLNSQLEIKFQQLKTENDKQRKFDAGAARLRLESLRIKESMSHIEASGGKVNLPPQATAATPTPVIQLQEPSIVHPQYMLGSIPRSPTYRVPVERPHGDDPSANQASSTDLISKHVDDCCAM